MGNTSDLTFTKMHRVCVNDPFGKVWNDTLTRTKSGISKETGWINSNSDGIPNTHYVYAVRVEKRGTHPVKSSTFGNAYRSKPEKRSVVNIFLDAITTAQQNDPEFQNYTLTQMVNHVIAHEVRHAVNLGHCSTDCLTNHPNGCMMDPYTSKFSIGYAPTADHYADYDLVDPVKTPKAADPNGKYRQTTTPPDEGTPAEPTRSLTSSSGSYSAEAGDSHTANFSTSSAYSSVYWYVKTPSDTSAYGTTVEIDQGDGSATTADMTYTFPTGTSGNYQIMAYVYGGDRHSR